MYVDVSACSDMSDLARKDFVLSAWCVSGKIQLLFQGDHDWGDKQEPKTLKTMLEYSLP